MSTSRSGYGLARWVRPLLVVLVALGAGALIVAPMVLMEPRDLPIAVVDLDEGFETEQGAVDAGAQVVQGVLANDQGGMIAWRTLDSCDWLKSAGTTRAA